MTSSRRVEDILTAMDAELVGLTSVKQGVGAIARDLGERQGGPGSLAAPAPVHGVFAGPPGVGKATVALWVARVLHALGRLRAPRVHRVARADLVAPFAGFTETKTARALREAAGGVLLVDEAYELLPEGQDRDHGREALDLVVRAMHTPAPEMMIVLSGDAERLGRFLAREPALRALVSHHLDFPSYTHEELVQIADLVLATEGFRFAEGGREAFADWTAQAMARRGFSNVRAVRRAIDRCRLRQARRIALTGPRHSQDLVTITREDVLEGTRE